MNLFSLNIFHNQDSKNESSGFIFEGGKSRKFKASAGNASSKKDIERDTW